MTGAFKGSKCFYCVSGTFFFTMSAQEELLEWSEATIPGSYPWTLSVITPYFAWRQMRNLS